MVVPIAIGTALCTPAAPRIMLQAVVILPQCVTMRVFALARGFAMPFAATFFGARRFALGFAMAFVVY